MASIGDLVVNLSAKTAGYRAGLKRAQADTNRFSAGAVSAFKKLAGVVGGLFTAKKLFDGFSFGAGVAADMETAEVSFRTLIGSAEQAANVMTNLKAFAAETPFEFPQLSEATKTLLAFGGSADTVFNELQQMGDIAAGVDAPVGDIARVFGKVRQSGRMMADEMNQLTDRGIPIVSELAKQFGVAESDVRDLVSAGRVGFPQLQEAFSSMTGEGGKFHNMMSAQSQTLNGLWSTLKDNMAQAAAAIFLEVDKVLDFKAILSGAISAVKNGVEWLKQLAAAHAEWRNVVLDVAADVADALGISLDMSPHLGGFLEFVSTAQKWMLVWAYGITGTLKTIHRDWKTIFSGLVEIVRNAVHNMIQGIQYMAERSWIEMQVLYEKSKRLIGMSDERTISTLEHKLDTMGVTGLKLTAPLTDTAEDLSKVWRQAHSRAFGKAAGAPAPATPAKPAAGDADADADARPDDREGYMRDVDPPWAAALIRGSADAYSLLVNAGRDQQQKEADWLKRIWEKTRQQADHQAAMRVGIDKLANSPPVQLATVGGLGGAP